MLQEYMGYFIIKFLLKQFNRARTQLALAGDLQLSLDDTSGT